MIGDLKYGLDCNNKPRISIIIPCYNHATYLREAIESALAQEYPNIEVIIIDDGSTDNTDAIASRYEEKIILLQQENKGLSAARNAGIRISSGEFILCLDADDRILPAFCTLTAAVLSNNASVGIVATGWRFFGELNYTVVPRAVSLVEQLATNPISCSALFRKSDWELVGGFDESMHDGFEDWELWIRLRKRGYELEVVPEILFEYRRKGSSMVVEALHGSGKILSVLHEKHADLYWKHFDEVHKILYSLYHRVRRVDKIEMVREEKWTDKVPVRLKYLAKAFLPNSVIKYMANV